MKKLKRLGICMDYSDAHLMVFNTDIIELNSIESTFTQGKSTTCFCERLFFKKNCKCGNYVTFF